MKKAISFLLATAIALGTLSGCAGSSGGASSATTAKKNSAASNNTSRTKISVLLHSSGSDETYKIWHTLFEGFAAQKNLKVEYETIAPLADYDSKLQLYISSDQVPDFYGCANGTLSKAAKNIGALVNVETELKKINEFDKLNKAVVDFLTDSSDKQMYLFPNALYAEFFFYRKDVFNKYNLTAPKTWDDFLSVCSTLKSKGETPVVVAGAENWQLMRYLSFIPWRVTHDKFITGYINGTDSFSQNVAAKAGVNLLYTLGTKGYFQKGFSSTNYTDATNLFFGGTGAIFYSGSGQIENASKMYQEGKLGMFPVPSQSGEQNISTNVPVHAGFGNAFNAKTYDSTMQEFLKYACENYTKECYNAKVFSPFNDAVPSGMDKLYYDIQPMFKNATQSWVSWDDKLDSATLTSMSDAQQELALGMKAPDNFMKQMDQVVKDNATS